MRTALLECSWSSSASWAPLAEVVDSVRGEQRGLDEFREAVREFGDKRAQTEGAVSHALASGKSVRSGAAGPAPWDHSEIATTALTATLAELQAFPRTSDAGKALAAQAAFVVQLREALLVSDWAKAATWAGLVALLDVLEPAMAGLDEVGAAWQEVADKRAATHEEVRGAMTLGRSVRQGSGWDHASIVTTHLSAAADECDAMPKQSAEGAALVAAARTCCEVRGALLKAKPMEGKSWDEARRVAASPPSPLPPLTLASTALAYAPSILACIAAGLARRARRPTAYPKLVLRRLCPCCGAQVALVLGMLSGPEQAGLSEVRAAWQEFKDARLAIGEALRKVMRDGRSQRRGGGGGVWDHSGISVTELRASLEQLSAFPAVQSAAERRASQADEDDTSSLAQGRQRATTDFEARPPTALNRASMVRLTEASAELSNVAAFLVTMRVALLADDWAEVNELLKRAEVRLH